MAYKWFCFWSFTCLCIHFKNVVQGRGLQQAEKIIDGPIKNGSLLNQVASTQIPLYSESEGYNFTRKAYNQSGSTGNEILPIFHRQYDIASNLDFRYAQVKSFKGEYYSTKATLSVHGLPGVGHNQASSALVWVYDGASAMKAGWLVSPELYGDNDTHFFVEWTDGDKGCPDLHCKGFVLDKHSTYIPGSKIRPISIYDGEQRYITMKISRDPQTGNWWLHQGLNADKPVGYWPKSLFTSGLGDHASNVDVGGVVRFVKGEKSPPMSSGHFPDSDPSKNERKIASISRLYSEGKPFASVGSEFNLKAEPICYVIVVDGQKLYYGGVGGCLY